ncbi:MAG: alpha-amylase family glycosyl hydrolase [Bacteroidales bacterium]
MNRAFIFNIILLFLVVSCGESSLNQRRAFLSTPLEDRIFYEIFVQSFYDTDGDGIGDLNGVTAKLDYLKELGVDGIWLMPIHPSPSYHKYDVTDYYGIHPDYGTMDDMKNLLTEAHRRNILVLIDMVINHTSSEHPFFKEARKDKDNPFRDYYVWSADSLLQSDEPYHWHNNGQDSEKYYGFFWKEMPDLNFDHPAVREEMKKIGVWWLTQIGVDGFRLDAIKYIYPDSLYDKNIAWWQEYRARLDSVRKEYFLVAEIWDDAEFIAPFLNRGVHAAFDFDLSFAIEEMLVSGSDPGLGDLLADIHQQYNAASASWYDAIFLKNHDQDRIMSLLQETGKARLAASVLLTLPGIPFIYYGEEIGMVGKKPDEYIREPMIWDEPGKDPGQTRWIEPRYSTPGKVIPVKQQLSHQGSLLLHYKTLIALRKEHPILSEGTVRSLEEMPERICGYVLRDNGNEMVVLHNLTDQPVSIPVGKLRANGKMLYFSGQENQGKDTLFLDPYGTLVRYRK